MGMDLGSIVGPVVGGFVIRLVGIEGWSPSVAKTTGSATYKATFKAKEKATQSISAKASVSKVITAAKTGKLAKAQAVDLAKLAKVSAKTVTLKVVVKK